MKKLSFLFVVLAFLNLVFAQKEIKETTICRTKGLSEVQVKKIEAVMKPIRLEVEKILVKENPELYKQYQKEIALFLKLKDSKAKKDRVHDLEDKYYKYFRTCYLKANINEKAARDSIAAIIPADIPYTFGDFLAIRSTSRKSPSTGAKSSADCPALTCPLDINTVRKYGNLAALGEVIIKDCAISTLAAGGIAGSGDFVGHIGQRAEFPAETPPQMVSAILDMSMWVQAGATAGGTYVESQLGLKIKGPSLDKRYVDYSLWAVAPVVWFTYQSDNGSQYEISTDMTPDVKGGIYVLQTYIRSFCSSGGTAPTAVETLMPKVYGIRMCEK